MPVIAVLPPWRDMICTDCRDRGLADSVWKFYAHFWGWKHDHACPAFTKKEIKELYGQSDVKEGSPAGTRKNLVGW